MSFSASSSSSSSSSTSRLRLLHLQGKVRGLSPLIRNNKVLVHLSTVKPLVVPENQQQFKESRALPSHLVLTGDALSWRFSLQVGKRYGFLNFSPASIKTAKNRSGEGVVCISVAATQTANHPSFFSLDDTEGEGEEVEEEKKGTETISYRGRVSKDLGHGVLELDDTVELYLNRYTLPIELDIRLGTLLKVHNVHPVFYGGKLAGLGCCTYSTIEKEVEEEEGQRETTIREKEKGEVIHPHLGTPYRLLGSRLSYPDFLWCLKVLIPSFEHKFSSILQHQQQQPQQPDSIPSSSSSSPFVSPPPALSLSSSGSQAPPSEMVRGDLSVASLVYSFVGLRSQGEGEEAFGEEIKGEEGRYLLHSFPLEAYSTFFCHSTACTPYQSIASHPTRVMKSVPTLKSLSDLPSIASFLRTSQESQSIPSLVVVDSTDLSPLYLMGWLTYSPESNILRLSDDTASLPVISTQLEEMKPMIVTNRFWMFTKFMLVVLRTSTKTTKLWLQIDFLDGCQFIDSEPFNHLPPFPLPSIPSQSQSFADLLLIDRRQTSSWNVHLEEDHIKELTGVVARISSRREEWVFSLLNPTTGDKIKVIAPQTSILHVCGVIPGATVCFRSLTRKIIPNRNSVKFFFITTSTTTTIDLEKTQVVVLETLMNRRPSSVLVNESQFSVALSVDALQNLYPLLSSIPSSRCTYLCELSHLHQSATQHSESSMRLANNLQGRVIPRQLFIDQRSKRVTGRIGTILKVDFAWICGRCNRPRSNHRSLERTCYCSRVASGGPPRARFRAMASFIFDDGTAKAVVVVKNETVWSLFPELDRHRIVQITATHQGVHLDSNEGSWTSPTVSDIQTEIVRKLKDPQVFRVIHLLVVFHNLTFGKNKKGPVWISQDYFTTTGPPGLYLKGMAVQEVNFVVEASSYLSSIRSLGVG